jgi:proline dehydrogenase
MAAFQSRGIGSILDLAMEADIDSATLSGASAQAQAAKIAAMMKESVDIAAKSPDSFIAAKVTAFVPPAVLLRWTNTLRSLQKAFDKTDADKDGRITFDEFTLEGGVFQQTFPGLKDKSVAAEVFQEILKYNGSAGKASVDWVAVSSAFSLFNKITRRVLYVPIHQTPTAPSTEPPFASELLPISESDFETADMVLAELDSLISYSKGNKVKVMIDAEQTYFQPAIDDISLFLSHKYNLLSTSPMGPTVFNTYQLYLKDALGRLRMDSERSERLGFGFGVKIVRGAYMVSERERAAEMGYSDPINSTLEDTHKSYNSAIETLLNAVVSSKKDEASVGKKVQFVVASHNKQSVELAVKMMKERGLEGKDFDVGFAQLMGMQDGTSFAIAANGYKAYKVKFWIFSLFCLIITRPPIVIK